MDMRCAWAACNAFECSAREPLASRHALPYIVVTCDCNLRLWQIPSESSNTSRVSIPGCLAFPPSQWINLIQWKYVDLAKVLKSAHTIELDPKQTHAIDDKVESGRVVLSGLQVGRFH